jgi:hypothetical protein
LSADEAGIVVNDIKAAKLAYGALNCGFDIGFGGDVSFLKDRTATILLTVAYRRFATFLVKVRYDDGGALTGETNCGRAAHATCCPLITATFLSSRPMRNSFQF